MATDQNAQLISFAGTVAPLSIPLAGVMPRPVGWPFGIWVSITVICSIYASSGPVWYLNATILSFLGWLVAFIWWAWRGIAQFSAARALMNLHLVSWKRFAALPVVLFLLVGLTAADIPSRIAFDLARPAMEQTASTVLSSPDWTSVAADAGIYGSCTFTREGDAVKVEVPGCGIDLEGFLYSRSDKSSWHEPLGGNWYRWHQHF